MGQMVYFCIKFQIIKIMFFALGDSVMKGVVAKPTNICEGTTKYIISDEGFANLIKGTDDKPVRNLARMGNTVQRGVANLDRYLKEINEGDTVVLEFGGNDCNFDWKAVSAAPEEQHLPSVSLKDFRDLYKRLIEYIRSIGARPVLLSLPVLLPQRFFDFVSRGLNRENILKWLGGDVNTISNWHEQYNQEVFKLGTELNVPVIDISTVFLDRRSLGDCYCIDGMHPNEKGHAIIAEAVMASGVLTDKA